MARPQSTSACASRAPAARSWGACGAKGARVALVSLVFAAAPALAPAVARAAADVTNASLPAGGGLGELKVDIDAVARDVVVHAGATNETIAIALSDAIDTAHVRTERVAVGSGRSVLRLIVPSSANAGVAWEALLAGNAGGPGVNVIWSGKTGGATSESGSGRVVVEGTSIFVGELRPELTICGQKETLLVPKRLDAASMKLHFVALERLPAETRKKATKLVGKVVEQAPIGSILGLRGASTNDGGSAALVDDDAATAWVEAKRGDGRGEFVVFSASKTLSIERLSFVVRPTKEVDDFAQAANVFVTTDSTTYAVELPQDTTPGARVDVVLPQPIVTSCLALSLENAYVYPGTEPAVGFAEVEAVPVVPATIHALDDVVTLLDAFDKDATLATALLSHAGARGAAAIEKAIGAMGDAGKARAIDVLEAAPCPASAPALVRLSWDAPKETTIAARAALDGCGLEAKPAIAEAFANGSASVKELVAERYAKLDPPGALEALLGVVPRSSAARRRTFRQALARVATFESGRKAMVDWLQKHAGDAPSPTGDPVIELGRALVASPELPSLAAPLSKALIARAGADFSRRFLAAEPMAAMAARGDQPALAWLRALFADPDRYLRARATAVSAPIEALRPELLRALVDADPRVRQEALGALRRGSVPGVAAPAKSLLANDPWTFVRVAAADLLGDFGSIGGGADIDVALAAATNDSARSVRIAALAALARRGARSQLPVVRARAFDEKESVDVRREAVATLGALCDASSADELFELAKRTGESDAARNLALTAIMALGRIHPPDLPQRLKALDASELVVKDAIARALKTTSTCAAKP